ncbi:YchJ family protein [Glutamicibacter halophytocola]|uniref:YchJ family protein n=1 Tax=Glutamicibacter halophytocola TaxID=1933880 RepID=UPI00096B3808|nr:YchJ family metal-binding protein [Glutamicibacter halophytocola]
MKNSSQTTCYCRELDSLKLSYQECCQRFHDGRADGSALPETAEQLMRSRYSAFVAGLAPYLLATWHESTRPQELELDPQMRWTGLEIITTRSGGAEASRGVVEFAAHYLEGQREAQQHEVSTFVRENGAWFYLDAL